MNSPRHAFPAHFTASGVVICKAHLLLVNHKRIGAWVPPGGHVEPNEMPDETVVREIFEETGIVVEVISDKMPETNSPDAFFLPRPLFLQGVTAVEQGQPYYHIDIAYLCRPQNVGSGTDLPRLTHNPEVKESKWFKLSEIGSIPLAKNVLEILDLVPKSILSEP